MAILIVEYETFDFSIREQAQPLEKIGNSDSTDYAAA
jgi:hypothetical protein